MELKEKAVSKKQQRFFGMVRAAQKGEGAASPEVAKVAGEISKKDAKDFAKTKHKGLPEKKKIQESPSIIKARGKRNTYMGATGDHRRDKEGNIEASFYLSKIFISFDSFFLSIALNKEEPIKPQPIIVILSNI